MTHTLFLSLLLPLPPLLFLFFFFNDTATTEIYTLSLHDALPISRSRRTPTPPSTTCWDEGSRERSISRPPRWIIRSSSIGAGRFREGRCRRRRSSPRPSTPGWRPSPAAGPRRRLAATTLFPTRWATH